MAAPTIVRNAKASVNASDALTCNCSFGATPAVGNLSVVFAIAGRTDLADPGVMTCADNQGNTYTSQANASVASVEGRISVFTAPIDTASGTFTVTVTAPTNATRFAVFIIEVAGYNANEPLEKIGAIGTGSITGGATVYSHLNFTTCTNAEQLFLALMGTGHVYNRNFDPSGNWLQLDEYSLASGQPDGCLIYAAVTDADVTAYDPSWTMTAAGGTGAVVAGISVVAGEAAGGKPSFYYAQL
jgi:hypothetical protein